MKNCICSFIVLNVLLLFTSLKILIILQKAVLIIFSREDIMDLILYYISNDELQLKYSLDIHQLRICLSEYTNKKQNALLVGLTFFVIIGYQILCRIQSILMVRLSLRTRGRAIPGKANPGASRQRQADHFSDNHLNPAFTGNAEYGHSTSSLIAHFWESILRVEILC